MEINVETSDDATFEVETVKRPNYPFWYGGAASSVACIFTHPLDLAKVRLQTANLPHQNMLSVSFQIVREKGVSGLYAGLSASLLRQSTYSTARFGVYESLKDHYAPTSPFILLGFSMVSGLIGGLVGNPADVVNIRMQNDTSSRNPRYRNAIDGLYKIVKNEGVKSLFSGLGPNLTRGVLMTSSQVVTYDIAKEFLSETFRIDEKLIHFSSSLAAGLVATTVCSPADVVKTRIMNGSSSQSAWQLLSGASKNEGWAFMFRGWVPAFLRLGPHTILTFLVLEELRKWSSVWSRQ